MVDSGNDSRKKKQKKNSNKNDLMEYVINCEQQTCEGHELKVEFAVIYTSNTVSCIAQPYNLRQRPIQILLPSSKCSNEQMMSKPLHWACAYGHLEVMSTLIDHGACVHSQIWSSCMTPFLLASENGQLEAINLLLAREPSHCHKEENAGCYGKIMDACDKWGNSALHLASKSGHIPVVNALLDQGMSVNRENCYKQMPIHLACQRGNLDVVKILLTEGGLATARARSQAGETPLHCASAKGHLDTVTTLLAYGGCIEDYDVHKRRPMHLACRYGHVELISYLLSIGANINAEDEFKQTPLHYASRSRQIKVVNTLIARGAAIDARDNLGRTPLHWACQKRDLAVAKSLMANGADTNSTDNTGNTPLHCIRVCSCDDVSIDIIPHRCCNIERTILLDDSDKEFTRALLQHGAIFSAPSGPDTMKSGCFAFTFANQGILLDYGMCSGRKCRLEKCACGKSELMCTYTSLRDCEMVVGGFENYFIKTEAAGLNTADGRALGPRRYVDWSQSQRAVYRAKCEAELKRLKTDQIADTSATYFDLLSRNLSSLRDQAIVGNFNSDKCVRDYPIYGDMIGCSYVRLRTFFLENQTPDFFYLTQTHLPPECAREIFCYLTDEDLEKLLKICIPHLARNVVSPYYDFKVIPSRKRVLECQGGDRSPSPS